MDDKKSELSEVVSDMSEFAGTLTGTAVVAGKKLICYINNLTILDTILGSPVDEEKKSEVNRSKISKVVN